jgi:hypothetical protein
MAQKILFYLEALYKSKYKLLFLFLFQILFRIPYFIYSETRMHGDEAFHWLVNHTILEEKLILRPFNHSYLGVFDFLFVFPFTFLFGNSAFSNQIGLLIIYTLYSFFTIEVAKIIFNDTVSKLCYYYFFIPSSYLMILSATYHGGHFGSAMFFLGGLFFFAKFLEQNKHSFIFISGTLFSISYYNSHLLILVISGFIVLISFYLLFNSSKNSFIYLFLGLLIGYTIEFISPYFVTHTPTHNSGILSKPFIYFKQNFAVIRDYGIDSVVGLLAHPFLRYYGYFYGETQQRLIHFISILFFSVMYIYLIYLVNPFSNFLNKLKDFRYYIFIAFIILFIINSVLVTALELVLDDFGIRYLMPIVSISPFVIFFFISSFKNQYNKIYYFLVLVYFLINIFGYLQGYTKKGIYSFEGSPGAIQVSEYLSKKNINYSFANHWIAYNLIKNSNAKHISSPFYGENIHYPKLHKQVLENSKSEKIAIIQIDILFDWYHEHLKDREGNKKILSMYDPVVKENTEGDFEILETIKIDRWRVFICKRINTY